MFCKGNGRHQEVPAQPPQAGFNDEPEATSNGHDESVQHSQSPTELPAESEATTTSSRQPAPTQPFQTFNVDVSQETEQNRRDQQETFLCPAMADPKEMKRFLLVLWALATCTYKILFACIFACIGNGTYPEKFKSAFPEGFDASNYAGYSTFYFFVALISGLNTVFMLNVRNHKTFFSRTEVLQMFIALLGICLQAHVYMGYEDVRGNDYTSRTMGKIILSILTLDCLTYLAYMIYLCVTQSQLRRLSSQRTEQSLDH